jgi:hypothetical protein
MNPMNTLAWMCHICGDERPDAKISVRKRQVSIKGIGATINVRYCNDREACIEGSMTKRFFDDDENND